MKRGWRAAEIKGNPSERSLLHDCLLPVEHVDSIVTSHRTIQICLQSHIQGFKGISVGYYTSKTILLLCLLRLNGTMSYQTTAVLVQWPLTNVDCKQ